MTPGKVKVDNPARLEQEEKAEEKRLAIMMMKKKEKYLYDKIMFGKKRKIREVCFSFPIDGTWIHMQIRLFVQLFNTESSIFIICHLSSPKNVATVLCG